MNNNKISQKQGVVMVLMFIIGSSSLLVMGLDAKMDIWLAILLAIGEAALIMLVYARLISVLPGKDLYETLEFFLGKIGSKIVLIFLTWFALDLCAIVLRNYGQFVMTVGLPQTPMVVSMFTLIIICAMAVRSGIETIGRWSENFVVYLVAFLIISVILVSKNMNINFLLPILDQGLFPVIRGAFGVVGFPFCETVVFLLVLPALQQGVSAKKIYLRGLLIGGSIIFIVSVSDMLVLGSNLAKSNYYPTYSTMATIHYGDFIQKLEVILAIVFIIAVFLKISILLFAACKGTSKILGFSDHKFIVFPMTFLALNFAMFEFDSMIYFHEWTFKVFPFYASFFEIVIPVTLLIIIQIKLKTIKNGVKKVRN